MSLEAGMRLSQYEIIAPLGAGGMGEVYRARDTRLDRDVALKVLPSHLASDPVALERFEREAKAVAALSHPNILAIHDFGTHDGTAYAVTELLEGETLRARLEQAGALPTKKAIQIAADIARGLAAAHDKHIVHRDVKPENVFLVGDGQVKILDFGLAKTVLSGAGADTATELSTDPGVVLGTAGYMAPEQVRGEPADSRSDIFALGCVLFEMSTGRRPFSRETVAETMTAILREDPPEPSADGRTVSPALDEVIRHCLEKQPAERFQSARDLAFALRALSGHQTTTGQAAVQTSSGGRTGRSRLFAVAAVTLAAGAGLGWWAASGGARAPSEPWAHLTQLTDEAGQEDTPVISPDGDAIAYSSLSADGSWDIYVQRIGGRKATPVASDPDRDESAPAFSPDGRTIAFHESDTDGGIWIVGATGESVRRVTDAGFHPAWSPDGRFLAFCDERIRNPTDRNVTSTLSVVNLETGDVRVVTAGDAVQPAWSPSGQRLAYWAANGGQRDIFTIAAAGGDPVQVTNDIALDWSVVWSPDGRYLYFSSGRGGAMNLWRVPVDETSGRATGDPEPVTIGVQTAAELPSLSKDGQRLVFRASSVSVNPAAIPLDPVNGRAGEPRFLFQRNGLLFPSSVSADGQWLAYSSRGAVEDIFVSRIDGTELRRVTDDVFRDRVPVWSPDGKTLVFYSNRSGSYEVWRVRSDGLGLTRLTDRPSSNLMFPFFEPSGKRLWAYDNDRPGPFVLSLDSSDQVTPQAGEDRPLIEVDGGLLRLMGISKDGTRLVGLAMSPAGVSFGVGWHDLGTGRTEVSVTPLPGNPAWLPDGRRIAFVRADGQTIALIDTDTRREQVLGPFPFFVAGVAPAVAPDGRTIFVGAVRAEADVWMVERAAREEK